MIYYIDIDDTTIRSIGNKIIPIVDTVNFIKNCDTTKNEIYLWSRGGAEYCKNIAVMLSISHKISGFLPKPNVIIDDTNLEEWNDFKVIHPNNIKSAQQGDAPEPDSSRSCLSAATSRPGDL